MTQLTAAEAALLNRIDHTAKKLGLGTRLRAVEGGTIATGTEAQLPICGADGVPAPKTISGDISVTAAGAVTIGNGKIGAAKLDGSLKNGTGAGYTIALVQAAFGDPAELPAGFVGYYTDSVASKVYRIRVVADAFVGEELTEVAVPAE
jgi:hypothetical protein